MLDNFGLGEFFLLALLALLFFGPERLPQMGAKLGQWIGKLTSYSRSFMTEWREEALAIQEAVAEVRGIRDEIMAAQQEISGSLLTARDDVVEGIEVARDAITDARLGVEQNLTNQRQMAARDLKTMAREEAASRKRDQSESEAIDRTRQILDNLHRKQETPAPQAGSEADTSLVPDTVAEQEPAATEAAAATTSPAAEESEWERNRQAIQEVMNRSKSLPPTLYKGPAATGTLASPAASAPAVEPAARESRATAAEPSLEAPTAPEEAADQEPRESAFDRTQKILDNLSKRRRGEIPSQKDQVVESQVAAPVEAAAPAEETRETAFDRTQQILDNLKKRRSAAAGPAQPVTESRSVPAFNLQVVEQLQTQVASLHDEIAALRREMETIRSASRSAADERAVEEAL